MDLAQKKHRNVNLKRISKLSKKDLAKELPKICLKTYLPYEGCQQGK